MDVLVECSRSCRKIINDTWTSINGIQARCSKAAFLTAVKLGSKKNFCLSRCIVVYGCGDFSHLLVRGVDEMMFNGS